MLFPTKLSASEVEDPPNDFERYAGELGLSVRQYHDVVADWRAKVSPSTTDHLANTLCRFIENASDRIQNRSRQQDTGTQARLADGPRFDVQPGPEGRLGLRPGDVPAPPPPAKRWKVQEPPSRGGFWTGGKDDQGRKWVYDLATGTLVERQAPNRPVDAPAPPDVQTGVRQSDRPAAGPAVVPAGEDPR